MLLAAGRLGAPRDSTPKDGAGPQTAGNLMNLKLRLLVLLLMPKLKPGLLGRLRLSVHSCLMQ